MDTNYYSTEAVLAEYSKLQCIFKLNVPDLGYVDGGSEKDIKTGTKILLPYWLAPTLSLQEWVDITIPAPYTTRVKKALDADARNVKLSSLVGGTGTWYGFGKMIIDLLQEPESSELAKVLSNTFKSRLIDLMDQAQHFGGAATSLGTGNDGENGGGDFREGFEATEREPGDSVQRTKEWYGSSDRRKTAAQ
ncbi:DNA replication protein [Tulasnella sp. 331]|nr:DNA replication protein [Tulasnella sp. 331]